MHKARPFFPTLLAIALAVSLFIIFTHNTDNGKESPAPTVETQQLPINFILRPISPSVYSYVGNAYGAHDKNQIILLGTFDDWCLGVPCEHWILKTHASQLPIMLRCYPTLGNQCVPTYEQPIVQIPDGNKPTITPVVGE